MNNLSFDFRKYLFILICLENMPNSSPSLSSITKRVKFKHNNMFMSKLVNPILNLIVYNILFLYIFV